MRKALTLKSVDKMKFSKSIAIKAFVLYIAVLCLGCFSVLIFVRGIKSTKEYNYTYTENNDIDYKVYLKENNYFEEEYLEKGTKYIASLIDKIDATFDYKLNSDDAINGNYTYYITATMEAKEKGKDVIIWSKEEEIFEHQSKDFEQQTNFEITPTITINYEKYNSIMSEFKSAYGVAIDANLVLTLHVDTDIQHEKQAKAITNNSISSISIPLLEQTIEIEQNYVDSSSKSNLITYKAKTPWSYVLIVSGIILFIYYLSLSVKVLKLIFAIYNNQNKYQVKLNKILSDYNQVIVKVSNLPNIKEKTILDVENFDDLLDVQGELREPILFKETIPNQESKFLITKDDRVFRYNMKYTDF